jgi:hypothetical protein
LGITATGSFNQGEMERTPSLVKDYGVMLDSLIQ